MEEHWRSNGGTMEEQWRNILALLTILSIHQPRAAGGFPGYHHVLLAESRKAFCLFVGQYMNIPNTQQMSERLNAAQYTKPRRGSKWKIKRSPD